MALEDEEENDRRYGGNRGEGHERSILADVGALGDEDDADSDGPHVVRLGDEQRPEEVVVDAHEGEDREGEEGSAGKRQDELEPAPELARAVDHRRLLEVLGDAEIELAKQEDTEG